MESGGNIAKGMRAAKYAKSTTNRPEVLTKSKAWPELMEEYLPDLKLAQKHSELLDSERDDVALRSVELGYKVKNKIPKDDGSGDKTVNIYVNLPDDQLQKLISKGASL